MIVCEILKGHVEKKFIKKFALAISIILKTSHILQLFIIIIIYEISRRRIEFSLFGVDEWTFTYTTMKHFLTDCTICSKNVMN